MSVERITYDAWLAEGKRRFGDDFLKWKFVCPSCGHVQAVEDFRPFKAQGATAEDARFNCIGRFLSAKGAFDPAKFKPCNYTLGGLFTLDHVEVVGGHPDHGGDPQQVSRSFHFAEAS